ncbi:MAG: hypothetical protein IJ158_05800 [Treponema sp.]|nr:hypothetical protein [Treponema sp.]
MRTNKLALMMIPPRRETDDSLVSSMLGNVAGCIEILSNGATEREQIRAKSRAVCAMLHERREVMVNYLNHRFGERNKLYDGYFALIDRAMESGNDEVTRLALESLLQVYSALFVSGDDFMAQYGKMTSALGE